MIFRVLEPSETDVAFVPPDDALVEMDGCRLRLEKDDSVRDRPTFARAVRSESNCSDEERWSSEVSEYVVRCVTGRDV